MPPSIGYGTNIVEISYEKPDNLVEILENTLRKFPTRPYIGEKDQNGVFQWITYSDFGIRVNDLRAGLAHLGLLKQGDKIGIIANNRLEWNIAAYATYGLGCCFVPMYERELYKIWKYIIQDSALKVLFVATQEIYDLMQELVTELSTLKKIILMGSSTSNPDSLQALELVGQAHSVASFRPSLAEIAMLIYTSGTTGNPKGVLLSHGNISSNAIAALKIFPMLDEHARLLSILPWAHSYGYTAELVGVTLIGGSVGITSVEALRDDLVKVQPSFVVAVPRLWNMIYDGIMKKMEEDGGIKKKMFDMAIDAAKRKRETGKAGLKFKLLDKLVFNKVRAKFGGKLQFSLTASAKNDPKIAAFFMDLGIPIYDAYGLTETSPAVTMNCPADYKIGSIGKPLEKMKIVIDRSVVEEGAKDGEIVVYGPNIMQGYLNKPEQTAAVTIIDENGIKGFRTGDRGWIKDGFVYITGRIKNEFKLLNGKYVHPQIVEGAIKLLPWVTNAMVFGDGKPYCTCLVVPDMDIAERYAKELHLSVPLEALLQRPDIQRLISAEIIAHLKDHFGKYEIPKKFIFSQEGFSIENKMLTQTFKLKRRNVLAKYQSQLEALYQDD
ncbi:MAG: AMP-dependent synthetase/ligase [Promethearchaeota archaeon]